jgi:hypothetical protein
VTGRQNERERVHSVGTCSSEQRWLTARSTRSHQAGASVQRKTAALPAQRAALQEEETAALPMREERHRKGRNRQRHSDPQEERHRTLERMHGRQPRVGGTVADGIRKEEGTDSDAPTRGRSNAEPRKGCTEDSLASEAPWLTTSLAADARGWHVCRTACYQRESTVKAVSSRGLGWPDDHDSLIGRHSRFWDARRKE